MTYRAMKSIMAPDKFSLTLALVALCVIAAFPAHAAGTHTILWDLPNSYTDATPIPDSLRSTIETRIYYSLDWQQWTLFAVVPNGGNSWTGQLPLADGVQGYYSATALIPSEGVESQGSASVVNPPSTSPIDTNQIPAVPTPVPAAGAPILLFTAGILIGLLAFRRRSRDLDGMESSQGH